MSGYIFLYQDSRGNNLTNFVYLLISVFINFYTKQFLGIYIFKNIIIDYYFSPKDYWAKDNVSRTRASFTPQKSQ